MTETAEEAQRKRDVEEEAETESSPAPQKKQNRTLTVNSLAADICAAFFASMDLDGNGFIEEQEVKIISVVAFNEGEDAASSRWQTMLNDMDENKDMKISRQEYISWWVNHTKDKTKPDGTFIEGYAAYLLKCLQRVTSVKTASEMCDAFFESMDENSDGFLVETEVKNIAKWAFGAKDDAARATWIDMIEKMDTNKDMKISREEYSNYWMSETKSKIQSDGSFINGYKTFLFSKLAKLKAGQRRQQQVKMWNKAYGETKSSSS
mmetsp:Transcript_12230/g.35467  ORF Transcript_12230/g.35467 Transcript_12230/m.35467 type:complete len:264 (-) Transcript_12230:173-964(-)|eukprot:CAMPEP_0119569678 /NCGR_PEP_ID=MMETSP1352-20130426/42384_1 /TAXON_ID=265584 /ORGANISM="Stauroneis constricta, Strain CCMP1120" /LENGTH=263 /DNA_ID=CAMNT_0007619267 /DNA_START=257 /DNA_END=1048 /DNA_ORIENTATION=-